MCYTIQQLEERILKQGQRKNSTPDEILEALRIFREQIKGKPLFAVSGFEHPEIPVLIVSSRFEWIPMHWGLIPLWCKDWNAAMEMSNMTLNARAESVFEKPAFKHAASTRRGVVPITGFYEYKHLKGKKFPFYIDWIDEEVRWVACVCDEWKDREKGETLLTFSIVTTKGNSFMAEIHNNPKLEEPRMPVMLEGQDIITWLNPETPVESLKQLMRASSDENMRAHSVKPLRGKFSPGNTLEAYQPYKYAELYEPPKLF
jgi:putative SOS response-associated peptidase YedK